jgi:hypothetical protein
MNAPPASKEVLRVILLLIGDDAKVGASLYRSRPLCAYLRLYTYANVFIRLNTDLIADCQMFMILMMR